MPTAKQHSPERDWRAWREATGLSLPEAARRAGINKGTLSMIENRRMVPEPREASALTDIYRAAAGDTQPVL